MTRPMTETTDELVGDISAMSDDELLRQINGFDPYDVEFARRFRALTAERDEARAKVKGLKMAIAGPAAEACGILRSYDEADGKRLWQELRAALKGDDT